MAWLFSCFSYLPFVRLIKILTILHDFVKKKMALNVVKHHVFDSPYLLTGKKNLILRWFHNNFIRNIFNIIIKKKTKEIMEDFVDSAGEKITEWIIWNIIILKIKILLQFLLNLTFKKWGPLCISIAKFIAKSNL